MILFGFICFMVCFIFSSTITFFSTTETFHNKKKRYILSIIQIIVLLFSITYFSLSQIGFTFNLIKHPINILPTLLLISSLTHFLTYFCYYKYEINWDFLIAGEIFFLLLCGLFFMTIFIPPKILAQNINDSFIYNKKYYSNNHDLKIQSKKDLFEVNLNISGEQSCDSFIESIYINSQSNYIKNISFKTKNITVNGIPYNGDGWPCKPLKNKISYQIAN